MKRCLAWLLVGGLLLAVPVSVGWARGFGGGGRFGGGGGGRFGGGGFGGGGFRGGDFQGGGFSGGGFRGGDLQGGGFSGGSFRGGDFQGGGFSGGGFRGGDLQGGGFTGGGLNGGSFRDRQFGNGSWGDGVNGGRLGGRLDGGAGTSGGRFGGNGLGGGRLSQDGFGDRFNGSSPSRSQLNNFLGLPSDGGMHNLSSGGLGSTSKAAQDWSNDFNVQHGSAEGPRGGEAAGTAVTGPRGNTAYRGGAVGPNGGVAAGRGVVGHGGAAAGQGVAVGPHGRAAAGGAVRGPDGGVAARGAVIGPHGYAAGFVAVSPSHRYAVAGGVRGNFYHWNYYGPGWYARYPGAWFAAGWAAGAAWSAATWNSVGAWFAYGAAAPIYYDYGTNVTYQDNNVYVNGQDAGTSEQYYQQASQLADTGTEADAPKDGDWLPLGVFAMCKDNQTTSNLVLQIAVNKQGIIRGNYTDSTSKKTELVHGKVDKKTQRVAFTIGDNDTTVFETGLYNLTKDEAPCLVHYGADRTEQWLLVRLKPNAQQQKESQQ